MIDETLPSGWKDKGFNINWQTFGAISLVFTLIVLVFSLLMSQWKTHEFESNRLIVHAQYEQQLNRLIETSADKVIQLANSASLNKILMEAIRGNDVESFRSEIEELDWNLQADGGLSVLALFDTQLGILHSTDSLQHQESVREVLQREAPSWRVDCNSVCRIVTYTAMLYQGDVLGVIVLAEPLSNVMLRFQHVSNIDTVLLSKNTDPFSSGVKGLPVSPFWERDLMALTNPLESRVVLDQASRSYSLDELSRRIQVLDLSPNIYELKAMPLQQNQLVVISNVSEDYSLLDQTISQTFSYSFLALLVGEFLLFILLRQPLRKLHRADAVERLAVETSNALDARTEALEREKLLSESVNDSVPVGIAVVDGGGRLLSVNRYLKSLFELSSESLEGSSLDSLIQAKGGLVSRRLEDITRGVLSEFEHVAYITSVSGHQHCLSWRYTPVYGEQEESVSISSRQVLVIATPLAEPTIVDERKWLDVHDTETGLLNQKGLEARLTDLIGRDDQASHALALLRIESQWRDEVKACLSTELDSAFSLVSLDRNEVAILMPSTSQPDAAGNLKHYCRSIGEITQKGIMPLGGLHVFTSVARDPLTLIQHARDDLARRMCNEP